MTDGVLRGMIRSLPALSKGELRELKQHVSAYLAGEADAARVDSEETLIYQNISDALYEATHSKPRPLSMIKGSERKTFDETALQIHAWIDRWVPNLTRIERNSVYALMSGLAVARVKTYKNEKREAIPLSMANVLNALNKPKELVDLAFPGYLEAGTFPYVIRQRLKGANIVRKESGSES